MFDSWTSDNMSEEEPLSYSESSYIDPRDLENITIPAIDGIVLQSTPASSPEEETL